MRHIMIGALLIGISLPARASMPLRELAADSAETDIDFNLTFPAKPEPWPTCMPRPKVAISYVVVEVPATQRVGNTLFIGVMRREFVRMETRFEMPDALTWYTACEGALPPAAAPLRKERKAATATWLTNRFAKDSPDLFQPALLNTEPGSPSPPSTPTGQGEMSTLPLLMINW